MPRAKRGTKARARHKKTMKLAKGNVGGRRKQYSQARETVEKGLTLVPLQLYFKNGRLKTQLALVKGKQAHDKREAIRKREVDRETRAAVKQRSR